MQIKTSMDHRWNDTNTENPQYSDKTRSNPTLSTTNPTWTGPGSNPSFRGDRPAITAYKK